MQDTPGAFHIITISVSEARRAIEEKDAVPIRYCPILSVFLLLFLFFGVSIIAFLIGIFLLQAACDDYYNQDYDTWILTSLLSLSWLYIGAYLFYAMTFQIID